MENKTGFDLNHAIENWRTEMAARESIGPERLRELESHMNDAMAEFKSKGLADEDAYYLAKRKMGESAEVAKEFEKEDPATVWKMRVYWILIGVLSAHFLMQIRGIVTNMGAIIAVWRWQGTSIETGRSIYMKWMSSGAYFYFQLTVMVASLLVIYFGSKWLLTRNPGRLRKLIAMTASPARMALSVAVFAIVLSQVSIAMEIFSLGGSPDFSRFWDILKQVGFRFSKTSFFLIYPIALAILIARVAPERRFRKKIQ